MKDFSRREFVALTVSGAVASQVASPFALEQRPAATVTAADILDRIKQNIGVPWNADTTMDTFKAGDPASRVTGVVVTSMATLDVLQQAAKLGANFVITAAPTFYSRADLRQPAGRGAGPGGRAGGAGAPAARGGGAPGAGPGGQGRGTGASPATVFGPGTGASAAMPPAPPMPASILPPAQPAARAGGAGAAGAPPPPDPVLAGKNAFIDKNNLVILRLSEHWNARKPDPRAIGLAAAMGWTKFRVGDDVMRYKVPAITMEALALQLKKVLGARGGIRAIGDKNFRVQTIGLVPGFNPLKPSLDMLPTVDVMITGEVQEWEGATYAQDVVFSGVQKGFISLGRLVNEQPGMQVCADWLKTLVPEVPVRFISAGDPYWRPL
jgi:putative NIF3 family GTP cyclohydrolase 1 type 2